MNFDLSAYAGKKVEVSLSYVTDPGTGGHGVFADEASLVVGGTATGSRGLRDLARRLDGRRAARGQPGRPGGLGALPGRCSRPTGRSPREDTVLLGFGLEHVTAAADRSGLVGKALRSLEGLTPLAERFASRQVTSA